MPIRLTTGVVLAVASGALAPSTFARCVDIAPIASLSLELLAQPPWQTEKRAWVPVWPHQNASAAAQDFCRTTHNFLPSCVDLIAAHLDPLLRPEARRALTCGGSADGADGDLSDLSGGKHCEGSVDVATAAAVAGHIAAAYNPSAILSLSALMAMASAIQRFDSPRILAL